MQLELKTIDSLLLFTLPVVLAVTVPQQLAHNDRPLMTSLPGVKRFTDWLYRS